MNKHETELIELDNKKVFIDKNLVPLIKEMNELGIKTTQCCEGYDENSPPHLYFWYGDFNIRKENDLILLNIVKFFDLYLDEVDPDCLIQNMWFNTNGIKFSDNDLRNKPPDYDKSFAHFYKINPTIFKKLYGTYDKMKALHIFINIWENLIKIYKENYHEWKK